MIEIKIECNSLLFFLICTQLSHSANEDEDFFGIVIVFISKGDE